MARSGGISDEAWVDFVEHFWEQRPVVMKAPTGAPLAEHPQIFPALVAAAEAYRARTLANRNDVRFFIDKHRVLDAADHLPRGDDETLAGYGQRVSATLGGRPYTLIVNPFQTFSPALWAAMREFLRGLYGALGAVPAGTTDAHIIVGDYSVGPFGLHKDPAGVFTFVVEGHKRMLVWPLPQFAHLSNDPEVAHTEVDLHGVDHEPFRGSATTLEGEAGDILYWPSTYWHAAESRGSSHATLHLALYLNGRPAHSLTRTVERLVSARITPWEELQPFHPYRLGEVAAQLPAGMRDALAALRDVASGSELERSLRLKWLCRVTGFGFDFVPPPASSAALGDDELVWLDPRYPIVWVVDADRDLLCSACGHAFVVAAHPHLIALFERINTGSPGRVGALIAEFSVAVDLPHGVDYDLAPEHVRAVLGKLVEIRGLTRSNAPPGDAS